MNIEINKIDEIINPIKKDKISHKGILSEMGSLEVDLATKSRDLRRIILRLRELKNTKKYVIESPEVNQNENIESTEINDEEIRDILNKNLGKDVVNTIDGSFLLNEKVKYLKGKLKEKKYIINNIKSDLNNANNLVNEQVAKIDILRNQLDRRIRQMELHRDKFYIEYISLHGLMFEKRSHPQELIPEEAWLRINHYLDLEDKPDKNLTEEEKKFLEIKSRNAEITLADFITNAAKEKEKIKIELLKKIEFLQRELDLERSKKHSAQEEMTDFINKQKAIERELRNQIQKLSSMLQDERNLSAEKDLEFQRQKEEIFVENLQSRKNMGNEDSKRLKDLFLGTCEDFNDDVNRNQNKYDELLNKMQIKIDDLTEKINKLQNIINQNKLIEEENNRLKSLDKKYSELSKELKKKEALISELKRNITDLQLQSRRQSGSFKTNISNNNTNDNTNTNIVTETVNEKTPVTTKKTSKTRMERNLSNKGKKGDKRNANDIIQINILQETIESLEAKIKELEKKLKESEQYYRNQYKKEIEYIKKTYEDQISNLRRQLNFLYNNKKETTNDLKEDVTNIESIVLPTVNNYDIDNEEFIHLREELEKSFNQIKRLQEIIHVYLFL